MPPDRIRDRFPTIYSACLRAGVDITTEPIPVVPAAHYFCGGVLVDEWGRSTIAGLYAVGEVSCTGLHGANRLASTSLLEGLVWGERAGRQIAAQEGPPRLTEGDVPPWEYVGENAIADPVLVYRDLRTIQHVMWLYVGLARNTHRLARALRELNHLWEAIDDFYRATRLGDELIGLRNAAQAAWVVTRAAWHNRSSRGTHYREDASSIDFASLQDMESTGRPPL
jgi:L-aspartate oxidase